MSRNAWLRTESKGENVTRVSRLQEFGRILLVEYQPAFRLHLGLQTEIFEEEAVEFRC